ncbi:MAG: glycerol kinase, partial [Peptostreptococcaceae bacterium]|nr:glycerol kinase [Peptostreptococcaceae bacterium]
IETTSLGAAYLAGLAVGYWKDEADIIDNWHMGKEFKVEMADSTREKLLKGWKRAVRCALEWAEEI